MTQLAGIPIRRVHSVHIHQICLDIVLRSADANTSDNSRIYGRACIGQYLSGMLLQRLPVLNGTGRKLEFILFRLTSRTFLYRQTTKFTAELLRRNVEAALQLDFKIGLFLLIWQGIVILDDSLMLVNFSFLKSKNVVQI